MVKQISYAGATFTTSDSVAKALIDLVAELGSTDSTMSVEVPAYDEAAGRTVPVAIVVGPSSEMVATPAQWSRGEPDDSEIVGQLEQRSRSLRIAHPIAEAADDVPGSGFLGEDPDTL